MALRTLWKNFVDSILRQATEKSALSIVNDQMGSPTYTLDLARAISELIQFGARGIFHVANGDFCAWDTFAEAILKLSGINRVKVLPFLRKSSVVPQPGLLILSSVVRN